MNGVSGVCEVCKVIEVIYLCCHRGLKTTIIWFCRCCFSWLLLSYFLQNVKSWIFFFHTFALFFGRDSCCSSDTTSPPSSSSSSDAAIISNSSSTSTCCVWLNYKILKLEIPFFSSGIYFWLWVFSDLPFSSSPGKK